MYTVIACIYPSNIFIHSEVEYTFELCRPTSFQPDNSELLGSTNYWQIIKKLLAKHDDKGVQLR